jgi:flagellar assembly factor FliW
MQINTTRFGEIEIDDKRIIEFPDGLPGFHEARRFVLLEHAPKNPFHWLQSMDDPALAFVVMDPIMVEPQYREAIPEEEVRELGITSAKEAAVLSIVTIDRENRRVTTNLLGPLVIHPETLRAKQVILEKSDYSTKHDISPPSQAQPTRKASAS